MSLENTNDDGPNFDGVDDDVAAFLTDITGVADPRKKIPDVDAGDSTDEDPVRGDVATFKADIEGDGEAPAKVGETPDVVADPDDTEITFKIGDAETKVRMSELRGLVERRAVVDRESAELPQVRTRFADAISRAETVLKTQLERAQAVLKPYQELDWATTRRDVDDATWDTLRGMATEADAAVNFLTTELDATVKAGREATSAATAKACRDTIAELEGPVAAGGIEGFGQALYGDIVSHAVAAGMPRDLVLGTANPAAVRLMHKAMLYDRAQAASKTVEAKITKVVTRPTATARPASKGTPEASASSDARGAMARLARTGSLDDAAAVFRFDLTDA